MKFRRWKNKKKKNRSNKIEMNQIHQVLIRVNKEVVLGQVSLWVKHKCNLSLNRALPLVKVFR